MFIRLKRHREICRELEAEWLHEVRESHRLHEELRLIRDRAARLGGPYKCLIECRELARELRITGEEIPPGALMHLSHIDAWIRGLAVSLSQGEEDYFHQKNVLKAFPVEEVYRDI